MAVRRKMAMVGYRDGLDSEYGQPFSWKHGGRHLEHGPDEAYGKYRKSRISRTGRDYGGACSAPGPTDLSRAPVR
jgi:hypothetical protein